MSFGEYLREFVVLSLAIANGVFWGTMAWYIFVLSIRLVIG